jgi:hypothetical protein
VHVGSNWTLSGYGNGSTVKWGFYSDVSGATYGGESSPSTSSIPGTLVYYLLAKVPGTTDVLVAKNTSVNPEFGAPTQSFQVSYQKSDTSMLWQTPTQSGLVQDMQTKGSGQNAYVSTSTTLSLFDSGGNAQWTKPFALTRFLLDTNGLYFVTSTSDSRGFTYSHYDLAADSPAQWSTTVHGTSSSGYAGYPSLKIIGNALCLASPIPDTGYGSDMDVRRYVIGAALSSLAPSTGTATVHSNKTITLKVSLNEPASAGGQLVSLSSSNSKLLFANNATTSSVAIPNGSLYALVTLHCGPVSQNTSSTVTASLSGVSRTLNVSVLP